jgi:SAM-dependent methyltransferase
VLKKQVSAGVSGAEYFRTWLLKQQWFSSVFLPALPRWLRWSLRKLYLAPLDVADRLVGREASMTPPRVSNFSGAVSDFRGSGDSLVQTLSEVAMLTPKSRVLDVGCGLGRLGAAMTSYLDADGAYYGLDIVPEGIKWCKNNISGPYGNINFSLADIFNKEYNPHGLLSPSQYRFPFEDETFNLIVLVSVFTHMLPAAVDNYLGEIARILKPKGRCFATYFLLTPESRRLMSSERSSMKFKHNLNTHWLMSIKVPEYGVAYEEDFVRDLYAKHKLSSEFYPGHWSSGSGPGDQDVLVGFKT